MIGNRLGMFDCEQHAEDKALESAVSRGQTESICRFVIFAVLESITCRDEAESSYRFAIRIATARGLCALFFASVRCRHECRHSTLI